MAPFAPTLALTLLLSPVAAWLCSSTPQHARRHTIFLSLSAQNDVGNDDQALITRRNLLLRTASLALVASASAAPPALAASRPPLPELLYTLLRVREATEQETRLIRTGKFKDVQRANIKLAVKFMVENYRLADTLVAAAAYLPDTTKRIEAGQVGQNAVQNLLTILEYFDAADVQNLKVGSDSLAGKEQIVLKGLDAARRNLDSFLAYFPSSEIDAASQRVKDENALNEKEFDPTLGVIINLKPVQ